MKDKKLYIGYSNDLKKRIEKHLNKKVRSTTNRLPLELIYYEAYKTETDAKEREKKLKYFGNSYGQLKRRIKASLNA
jgi:putative endonuclease